MFISFDLVIAALNIFLSREGAAPLSPFLPFNMLFLWACLAALVGLANLMPDFLGLQSPRLFDFDISRNAFSVDNRQVGALDMLDVRLQDRFGPSRRAFRIVVISRRRRYLVAQTHRITIAVLSNKEFPLTTAGESLQTKYWFLKWADYDGAKTGFDPAWPDYREIFALHDQINEYIGKASTHT